MDKREKLSHIHMENVMTTVGDQAQVCFSLILPSDPKI